MSLCVVFISAKYVLVKIVRESKICQTSVFENSGFIFTVSTGSLQVYFILSAFVIVGFG